MVVRVEVAVHFEAVAAVRGAGRGASQIAGWDGAVGYWTQVVFHEPVVAEAVEGGLEVVEDDGVAETFEYEG